MQIFYQLFSEYFKCVCIVSIYQFINLSFGKMIFIVDE